MKSEERLGTDPFWRQSVLVSAEADLRGPTIPDLATLRELQAPRQGRVMGFIFSSGNWEVGKV